MSLMDYHALTVNEPRDTPASRLQFKVICSVMAAAFVYTLITSGALLTVHGDEAPFPGGNFCYKMAQRDYAASMGMGRNIEADWQMSTMGRPITGGDGIKKEGSEKSDFPSVKQEQLERMKLVEDRIYHVYLDDPMVMSAVRTRWMTGVLVADSEKGIFCDPLLAKNPEIRMAAIRNKDKGLKIEDMNPKTAFDQTKYELIDLPSVDSLVVQFPFTNGFVSALLFSYKILPAMRRMAASKSQEGNELVVISHCNTREAMCTHYVPLSEGKEFLAGQPTMAEHMQKFVHDAWFVNWEQFKGGVRKVFPFLKEYIDMLP